MRCFTSFTQGKITPVTYLFSANCREEIGPPFIMIGAGPTLEHPHLQVYTFKFFLVHSTLVKAGWKMALGQLKVVIDVLYIIDIDDCICINEQLRLLRIFSMMWYQKLHMLQSISNFLAFFVQTQAWSSMTSSHFWLRIFPFLLDNLFGSFTGQIPLQ